VNSFEIYEGENRVASLKIGQTRTLYAWLKVVGALYQQTVRNLLGDLKAFVYLYIFIV